MTGPLRRVTDSGSLRQQTSDLAARVAREVASTRENGTVVAIDSSGGVTVNVAGNTLTALTWPAVPLHVGDTVRVGRQGQDCWIDSLVVASSLPTQGTIAGSPAGQLVPITTALGTVQGGWSAAGAYSPTVGDLVWLTWLGTFPLVVGPVGAFGSPGGAGGAPPVTPPAPPSRNSGTQSFAAVDSGTFRSGQWQSQSVTHGNVMQGDYGYGTNSGVWFYGGRIHSTLAGATVTKIQIWLSRLSGGTYAGQAVHLCRVTDNKKAGAPSFDTSNAVDVVLSVGQSGWFTIPTAIGQALVDSGGSIGVQASNPYLRLAGLTNNGDAGALQITWSR